MPRKLTQEVPAKDSLPPGTTGSQAEGASVYLQTGSSKGRGGLVNAAGHGDTLGALTRAWWPHTLVAQSTLAASFSQPGVGGGEFLAPQVLLCLDRGKKHGQSLAPVHSQEYWEISTARSLTPGSPSDHPGDGTGRAAWNREQGKEISKTLPPCR